MSWLDDRCIPTHLVPTAREWLDAQEWATTYSDDFTPLEQPKREPFPRCETCEHEYHGLPCGRSTKPPASTWPTISTPCDCQGPFATEEN